MGHFTQLDDDDAELLAGGKKPCNPSNAYNGSNYGHYKKGDDHDLPNPGGKLGKKNK